MEFVYMTLTEECFQMVNDGTHLSAMQCFLKEQFLQIKGLEDIALVRKILPESVQVLHVNVNHWLTVSTLNSSVDVTIYDSLHFILKLSLLKC